MDGDPYSRPGCQTDKSQETKISRALTYAKDINRGEPSRKRAYVPDNKYQLKVESSGSENGGRRKDDRKQAILPLPLQEFPWKRANRKAILYTGIKWSKELGESSGEVSAGRPEGVK